MDPNETLKEIRELTEKIIKCDDVVLSAQMADGIADRFQALDNWLSNNGFLPDDWDT